MALTPTFTITPADNGQTVTIDNTTTYGNPNQDRDDAAEFLLWSKTDKSGVRTYDNPDQGNVLTNIQYITDTLKDGWYELINLRIQFYDSGASYVEEQSSGSVITQYASVFYYSTTGKVYKAIAPSTGQDPEDTDYFVEVPLDQLHTLIDNTNIEVYIKDYDHDYATNEAIRDRFANVLCCTAEDRDRNQTLLYMKQSADTNFANGRPEDFEKIIREIEAQLIQP
jgi:hypothetical protein